MDSEKRVKIVVLGVQNVGKTSILHRYASNSFNPLIAGTIIAAHLQKDVTTSAGPICLELWDTAGQEKYRSLAPQYLRGSQVAIIVASVDNVVSAKDISYFMNLIAESAPEDVIVCAVLNKIDLPEEVHHVTKEAFEHMVESLDSTKTPAIFTVSAKTGANIDYLFSYIIQEILQKVPHSLPTPVALNERKKKKKKCCK